MTLTAQSFDVVDSSVLRSADSLRERFMAARPFPHVIVDGFFVEHYVRELVEQFPPHRGEGKVNEFGAPGIKAVYSDLTQLGPAYRKAHEFFGSAAFLEWLSSATGIPGLLYDPQNFGGGTHENLDGRDLRPHVDFNFHPVAKLHRRVNLIVYLNEGWQPEWGGNITLHSDPRSVSDEATSYVPSLNRCIIFETSERSWHSFDLIRLPDGEKHRSRKSLSLYFYSKERPEDQIHAEHTTFFVPRGLPERFKEGYTLTREDAAELDQLMGQRERLIALYQREQGTREADSAQAARLRILVAQLRAKRNIPIMGYVRSQGDVSGMYDDGWNGAELQFTLYVQRAVRALSISAIVPQGIAAGTQLRVDAGGVECVCAAVEPGHVNAAGALRLDAGSRTKMRIRISATANHKALGLSSDERNLGFLLQCITFEHEAP
jgi:hypothetical protein